MSTYISAHVKCVFTCNIKCEIDALTYFAFKVTCEISENHICLYDVNVSGDMSEDHMCPSVFFHM